MTRSERRKGSDVSAENRLSRLYEMAKEGDIVIADKLGMSTARSRT